MTKKDYERAATIAQQHFIAAKDSTMWNASAHAVVDAFATLFRGDNERFDETRFRHACRPGANVKARTAHLKSA